MVSHMAQYRGYTVQNSIFVYFQIVFCRKMCLLSLSRFYTRRT